MTAWQLRSHREDIIYYLYYDDDLCWHRFWLTSHLQLEIDTKIRGVQSANYKPANWRNAKLHANHGSHFITYKKMTYQTTIAFEHFLIFPMLSFLTYYDLSNVDDRNAIYYQDWRIYYSYVIQDELQSCFAMILMVAFVLSLQIFSYSTRCNCPRSPFCKWVILILWFRFYWHLTFAFHGLTMNCNWMCHFMKPTDNYSLLGHWFGSARIYQQA